MIFRRIKKPDPKKEEELQKQVQETGLEKGDRFAMILSAWLTIGSISLVVLLILVGLTMLFFRLF